MENKVELLNPEGGTNRNQENVVIGVLAGGVLILARASEFKSSVKGDLVPHEPQNQSAN